MHTYHIAHGSLGMTGYHWCTRRQEQEEVEDWKETEAFNDKVIPQIATDMDRVESKLVKQLNMSCDAGTARSRWFAIMAFGNIRVSTPKDKFLIPDLNKNPASCCLD